MAGEATVSRSSQSSFVGRERELAELSTGLYDARSGRGRFFLVTGEPGIGKSRLAGVVAEHAASHAMLLLRAGSSEGAGTPAYWSFIQLLRAALGGAERDQLLHLLAAAHAPHVVQDLAQLVPELRQFVAAPAPPYAQPPPDREEARFRLSESVALALKALADIRPLMVIVEDLHDTDQSSLQMLRFVVRQLKGASVLVLGTYRDIDVQRLPTLAQLIGDLVRESTPIRLLGLRQEETAQMIDERAGAPPTARMVSAIYQATAGNPLFIDGLVRVLCAQGTRSGSRRVNLAAFRVPDGVRQVIRGWIALIPDRSVLRVAATIGQEFDLRCLRRVTGLQNHQLLDALREAAGVAIVNPLSQGAYSFSHALIRNALSDEIGSVERAPLHVKIGEAQEELYRADIEEHVAELARHFHAAGDVHKAVDYSIRAGEAANALFAYEQAVAHWETALELMPETPENRERRAELLERTADLLSLTASDSSGLTYLKQASKIYEELHRPEAVLRVEVRISGWLAMHDSAPTRALRDWFSPDAAAIDRIRRDLESLPGQERERRTALLRLRIGAASVAMERGDVEQGLTESRKAIEEAEQLGDVALRFGASFHCSGGLFLKGRLGESSALLARVYEEADLINDIINAALAVQMNAYRFMVLRDPTQSIYLLQRELEKPRMAEAPQLRAVLFDFLHMVELYAGKRLRADEPVSQPHGDHPLSMRDLPLSRVLECVFAGQWERAESLLSQAADQARQSNRHVFACDRRQGLAKVRRTLGPLSAAEAIQQEDLVFCTNASIVVIELQIRAELASIYAETGRPEDAETHLARCHQILAAGEDWRGLVGQVARAEAVVAAAEGRFEVANQQFAEAAEIFRRYSVPLEEAETLTYWARALLAAGEKEKALQKLDAETRIYRSLGLSERYLERVEADRLRAQSANPESGPLAPRAYQLGDSALGGGAGGPTEDPVAQAVFLKSGKYWTLSWAGSRLRLKDRKGLRCIAYLLAHPGREFPAQELVAAIEPARNGSLLIRQSVNETHRADSMAGDLGDAGAALDATAKAQYKRRLADLREELELAEQRNDLGHVAMTRHEIEFLNDEIAASIGLHGRDRRIASHAERARQAVTKSIKAALKLIREADAELARHLSLSIKTGYFCAYVPISPVNWRF